MSLDAMKQALEALETKGEHHPRVYAAITALRAAIEQAEVRTIKTWRQRCEEHPDHNGIVSEGMIQARMQEEIDELRAAIEQAQEPVAWVYPEGLEALKSGRPWTAYGSNGDGRIPLYLNDAVAPRAEPRASGSGAGFESLPASPNQPEKNHD